ncbi:hypothetical protein IP70_17015 [alpha proteobacterium AAP38]|nr:hypothetical protein IP70_17015 [alpha proteobacterium AAP38]
MNTPTLSAEQIDDLARQWFRQVVAQWETKTVVREKFQSLLSVGGTPLAPEAEASVLEGMRARVQKALAENDLNPAVKIADALLRDAGLDIPVDSPEYKRVCWTVLRAQAEYFKLTAAWRNGDFGVAPTDPLFAASLRRGGVVSIPPSKPKSMPLNELVGLYINSKQRDGQWKAGTVKTTLPKLRLFAETLSNKPVDDVTRDDVRNWRDFLSDLELNNNTIGLHFRTVSALFNWAKLEGKCQIDNPLRGLAPPKEDSEREAFTPEDLRVLFSSPLYVGHWRPDRRDRPGSCLEKDHKYWLPLISLHSGLRVEEAAKLRVDDVTEVDGVWCFRVTDAKTKAGNRVVPLHPRLIDLGLLTHREAMADDGRDHMWPDITVGSEGRYSQYFVQWWSEFRHLIGLGRGRLVFHSFRHTFVSTLMNGGVPESTIKKIVGHALQGITAGVYGGKLLTTRDLLDVISRFDFGVSLDHLSR